MSQSSATSSTNIQFEKSFRVLSAVIETAQKVLERWEREYRIQQDLKHVQGMADWELKDIGVTREGIERAVRYGRE